MRHLMNPLDFSVEELDKLFALAASSTTTLLKAMLIAED